MDFKGGKDYPILVQSSINMALKGQMPWKAFELWMEELASTLPRARLLNKLLMNQLKTYQVQDELFEETEDIYANDYHEEDKSDHLKVKEEIFETVHDAGEKNDTDNSVDATSENIDENSSKIKCDICNKSYMNVPSWRQHMRSQHGQIGLKIKSCKKGEKEKTRENDAEDIDNSLNVASEVNHDDSTRLRCDTCKKTYASWISLNKHINHIHGIRTVICEHCNKEITRGYISMHKKVHCPMRSEIPSPIEPKADDPEEPLEAGEVQDEDDLPPRTPINVKKPNDDKIQNNFMANIDLKPIDTENITEIVGENPSRIECNVCHKSYLNVPSWRQHMRSQHGQIGLKVKSRENDYENFEMENDDEDSSRVKCEHCQKSYKKASLNNHIRYQHGQRTRQCENCDREIGRGYFSEHQKKYCKNRASLNDKIQKDQSIDEIDKSEPPPPKRVRLSKVNNDHQTISNMVQPHFLDIPTTISS